MEIFNNKEPELWNDLYEQIVPRIILHINDSNDYFECAISFAKGANEKGLEYFWVSLFNKSKDDIISYLSVIKRLLVQIPLIDSSITLIVPKLISISDNSEVLSLIKLIIKIAGSNEEEEINDNNEVLTQLLKIPVLQQNSNVLLNELVELFKNEENPDKIFYVISNLCDDFIDESNISYITQTFMDRMFEISDENLRISISNELEKILCK